ncbi:2-amino-4-hydroxy-6-hydroxymethyldihydropteridine diphosphokinase [Capnocytophaga canimorsus]|uniref:2-amino-4-hydroxy-6- hydroxymethyldihydropteridine diphosphokinase n=1 Tax=Capnocytophaga canimorsus TaxID=28188 RepID=UPI0005899DC7|nr:2-amino-4-hydroxy-6-hydroxymethyldihydropteridine diphosphokinase [Capnocytophaga canimorsus]CEN49600.1 Deoxyguanosine kinase [Capnocytophaga canimorsus]VEJ19976.1 Deoxyguanosine kinase [Capnocytophaga canimorsus]
MRHKIYIALGSNLGDRKIYLQQAIDAIEQRIGRVVQLSQLYETASWGFQADAFYNLCVLVRTDLSTQKCLEVLLSIENELGRVRSDTKLYQSRTIDLDILLYDNQIIETEELQVPHPQIQNRKFVLFPLVEIAHNEIHPVLKKSIKQLSETTADISEVIPTGIRLTPKRKKSPFANYNYIAIEGNIGAGKTTLATKIAEDYNAKLILERFADNPFLPKFYENPKRYGFTLEMSFLTERYQQMAENLAQLDLFKQFVVSDYDIFKSLIFSAVTLTEEEFSLYRKLFYILYRQIVKPELYIYLYQNPQRLIENIQKRGRLYEQNISKEYLKQIHDGYLQFIQNSLDDNILIIDVTELDFVENPSHYEQIITQIDGFQKI